MNRLSNGFSLVELIIAISILSIGLLATATMLAKGIGANRFAQRVTIDSTLAYSVLDEILAKDPSDVLFDTAIGNAVYDLDTAIPATTRSVQGVVYSATYSIAPDTPVAGSARVSVTITGGGRPVTLTSFKRSI
jgi:type IV pilus assembly protein PilV